MKVCIHRGANEVGGSCVEIIAGDHSIVVDAGLPLTDSTSVSPPALKCRSPIGIVISHPHADHFGLLPWMPTAPILMGSAARRILHAAAPFMRQQGLKLDGPDLVDRQTITFGGFQVTPFLVDHSAYDAYALLIEAEGRRLFYSGDIRKHGRKRQLVESLIAHPPDQIDVLLLEGTTIGRVSECDPKSEDVIEDELTSTFRTTRGLSMVHASAQNVDRIVSIFRACKKSKRTLVIDLYTAEILAATGNSRIPQSDWEGVALCLPQQQRIQVKNNGWFEMLHRHSRNRIYPRNLAENPGAYTLLFRNIWMHDLEREHCLTDACMIHSQWAGYLKEARFSEVISWLQNQRVRLLQIHTSGHASFSDLKSLAAALAPGVLVPIHSEVPEMYSALYSKVVRRANGEWWEV